MNLDDVTYMRVLAVLALLGLAIALCANGFREFRLALDAGVLPPPALPLGFISGGLALVLGVVFGLKFGLGFIAFQVSIGTFNVLTNPRLDVLYNSLTISAAVVLGILVGNYARQYVIPIVRDE